MVIGNIARECSITFNALLYAEHTKFWILGATGSLLPVRSGRTGGQAASGTQTDSVILEPKSWCDLHIEEEDKFYGSRRRY
jgi:hypothetical protein